MAIGGLRNTAGSVSKLSFLSEFGLKLGKIIRDTLRRDLTRCREDPNLNEHDSWTFKTCACVGKEDSQPPTEAVDKIGAILKRHTKHCWPADKPKGLSDVNTMQLEAWRKAAKHPDVESVGWLDDGGPAGIKCMPTDAGGIFPDCSAPALASTSEIRCDADLFRNYAGVEEHAVTEEELQLHIDAGHLAEFDSYEDLSKFVGATEEDPAILSKLGLIIKERNGVQKARMILDTKESGVGRLSGKYQRVILPRLFDAIIRLLFLMSCMEGEATHAVLAFVLDFTQAFWQIPIRPEERKYYCATAILRGKRRFLAYLRAAQGSAMAPLLFCRVISLVMCLT